MLRSVILSASNSCFVACPGCYNYFGKHIASTPDIVAFVMAIRDRFHLDKVTVGGGDPLTRPDILSLLTQLRGLGLRLHLDTVGSALLGDSAIRFMGRGAVKQVSPAAVAPLIDLIGIPLDGTTDEISQRFRRFSSVGDQLAILDLLHAAEARVCINTVVHSGNLADIARIGQRISACGAVVEWQLFQFMPIGPLGNRNRERFEINPQEFMAAVDAGRRSVRSGVRVEPKSAARRKNRYLLIDSEGVVWVPEQHAGARWESGDVNGERVVIGTIGDPGIVEQIAELDAQDGSQPGTLTQPGVV